MARRSQPNRLLWPPSPEQWERIDEMFQELYDDTDNGSLEISMGQITSGVLDVDQGGTGNSSWAVGDILYASDVDEISGLAAVAAGSYLRSAGLSTAPVWSTVTLPNTAAAGDIWYASASNTMSALTIGAAAKIIQSSGTAPAWSAFTLPTSVTTGDLWYGSATNVVSALAAAAAGKVLRAAGAGTAPAWSTFTIPDTFAQGDLIYASAANTLTALAKNTSATRYLSNTGTTNNPAWAQVDLTNGVTGTLPATSGGTGTATVTTGDLLYGSAANTWSKLADVAVGSYLRSGGVTTAPLWSTLKLPNASSQGDIFYADAANNMTVLAKNTSATRYLSNTGTTNNPAWAQIDLTNGVTGTLPQGNGGTNATSFAANRVIHQNAGNTAFTSTSGFTFDGTTLAIPGQLAFPATQVPSSNANTLDDYEEGTFSPTVHGTSGSGVTYTTQSGAYIKVGRMVYFILDVVVSGLGTAAGVLSIGGLPFTVSNATAVVGGAGMFYFSGMAVNDIYFASFASPTTTDIDVYGLLGVARAAPARYTIADLTATSRMAMFGIYNASA